MWDGFVLVIMQVIDVDSPEKPFYPSKFSILCKKILVIDAKGGLKLEPHLGAWIISLQKHVSRYRWNCVVEKDIAIDHYSFDSKHLILFSKKCVDLWLSSSIMKTSLLLGLLIVDFTLK